ncbi:MAG: lipopolysaccharide kinase InaA family protein [Acidobacteriota bacterium]
MIPAPEGFVQVKRGQMWLYLRESHAEALLGIQVQRIGEWLYRDLWDRNVSFGRGMVAIKRPALPDGSGLVIKGYRHGGLFGNLLSSRYPSPRRALEAVAAGDAARRAGVPVPLVVVVAAERVLPFGFRLYEASVEVLGAEPLSVALGFGSGPPAPLPSGARSRRRMLVEACGRSIRALHDARIDHTDLNLANLLATNSGSGTQVYVHDFDSAIFGPSLSPARRLKALQRLYRSAVKLHPRHLPPPPLMQARWLRAYCEGDDALARYLISRRASFSHHVRRHRLLWKQPDTPRSAA